MPGGIEPISANEGQYRDRLSTECGDGVIDGTLRKKILKIPDEHRIMTVATNRPDGWPQATTVGYVNDGLTLYFLCSPQSQKRII
jgi:hypothetical protein